MTLLRSLLLCTWLLQVLVAGAEPSPRLRMPGQGIGADALAVVINDKDPLSAAVGELYARERGIPPSRIVRLAFPATSTVLSAEQFAPLKRQLDRQLGDDVQGLLLTWVQPWRVDCMSITSAFAFGYDKKFCARKAPASSCGPTPASPYFNSGSDRPWTQLRLRPTMLLGVSSVSEARALIARGLAAEHETPPGTAYLLSTSDKARNVRAANYVNLQRAFRRWLPVEIVRDDTLQGRADVMFYFTGLPAVDDIESNTFLPGAVADHLTSFGGMLTASSQMSALQWIKAGASGSFGTVTEPCAFPQKFPDPAVLMQHYLAGERLIEAYWKSVAWPAEGLFIGDPLARPFPGYAFRRRGQTHILDLPYLQAGTWVLQAAEHSFGPFKTVGRLVSRGQDLQLTLDPPLRPFYRLVPVAPGKPP